MSLSQKDWGKRKKAGENKINAKNRDGKE